jgi:hypothetical protein
MVGPELLTRTVSDRSLTLVVDDGNPEGTEQGYRSGPREARRFTASHADAVIPYRDDMLRLWIVVVFVLGCGSEPSPVEKCDALVDELCDRGVQCVPNSGTHAQCVQTVETQLSCGSVKAVSPSYDRCMDQLQTFSCQVLFPVDPQTHMQMLVLPADCMSVVLSRTLDGDAALDRLVEMRSLR